LGAGAGAVPLLLGAPHLSLLCGVVYVIEGASVILQVLYYKRTKKRLFLMAPIHHHLEKCGWSEGKIVAVFVLISTLAAALSILL
jgi:phospho-N-acetylmuramoyl-pentapeptide-transferase